MTYNEIMQKVGKKILKKVYYKDGETIVNVDKENIIKVKPSFSSLLIGTVMQGIELELKTSLPDKDIYVEIVASYNGNIATKEYGPYYLKEDPKYNADEKTYTMSLYDGMLKLMKNYIPIEISYPCTIYNYFSKLIQSVGLKNDVTSLPNGNLLMYSDVYKDIDNFTKRDALHDIGQANGVLFYIDKDTIKIAEFGTETVVINDDILKNSNIEFGEHFGPINSIVLSRSADSDSVFLQDEESIQENGLNEFKISDNQLMNDNNRNQFLPALLNRLDGIEYDIFDTELVGYGGFNPLQKVEFHTGGNVYKSFVFNNEIEIEKGISEAIYTDMPEESETNYKASSTTDKMESMIYRIADKQNKKIEDVIQEVGETSEKISNITQTIDEINSTVQSVNNFKSIIEGINPLVLKDALASNILRLEIHAENYIFGPHWERYCTLVLAGENQTQTFHATIPIDLEKVGNVSDLIVVEMNSETGNCVLEIEKYIDGLVVNTEPEITIISENFPLKLFEGENKITVYAGKNPPNLKMVGQYLSNSELNKYFASKVEVKSEINQAATEISQSVIENIDDESFGTKIVQTKDFVQLAWNQIGQNIKIEVGEDESANFNIYDENGNLLMSLNKDGMTFYNNNLLGKMGVVSQGNQKYIAFNIPIDFNSNIENGFAWGLTNKTNGQFYPVLYIKDFYMGPEQSDIAGGQLVLANCGLTIEGQNMLSIGNLIISMQDPVTGDMTFLDKNTMNVLMKITPQNDELGIVKALRILDQIGMYVNQEGAELFHVGNTANNDSFWTTSNGYVHCKNLNVGKENDGSIYCHGNINASGDLSAIGYVSGHIIDMSWHENKKDINKYTKSALEEIKNTDIYSFLYKDGKISKKTIGAVIGGGYKCSDEIVSEDGKHVSMYSMVSLAYKAIQEQQEEIESLKKRINKLEGKNETSSKE